MSYTKGKWLLRGNEIGVKIKDDDQSYGMLALIATVDAYDLPDNVESNKSLICAAPALLEALEEFTEMYCEFVDSGDAGKWNPEDDPEVVKARAAIALARGNS